MYKGLKSQNMIILSRGEITEATNTVINAMKERDKDTILTPEWEVTIHMISLSIEQELFEGRFSK